MTQSFCTEEAHCLVREMIICQLNKGLQCSVIGAMTEVRTNDYRSQRWVARRASRGGFPPESHSSFPPKGISASQPWKRMFLLHSERKYGDTWVA